MPLFQCSAEDCKALDNTSGSCTNYWMRKKEGKLPLCSACDPEIDKWHGQFDRKTAEQHGYVKDKQGFWDAPKKHP